MARLSDKVISDLNRDIPTKSVIDRCCSYLKKHVERIDYGSHRKGGYPSFRLAVVVSNQPIGLSVMRG